MTNLTISCPHCNKNSDVSNKDISPDYQCGWCENWIRLEQKSKDYIIVSAMFEPEVYQAQH